jgi:hypothetical protein
MSITNSSYPPWKSIRCTLYSNIPAIFIPLAYSLYFIHGFIFIILFYFTFNSLLFRHYRTFMVINKKYEQQFNFFVCSWIDVEWSKDSWDWEMRSSNKQMEVKSIFGSVGGYISGPTSNSMTQDTSDRESAQIRRYHIVICLPRCHGNTNATSHWLNLWERWRLNRYKVAGRRSSVRLYILFTWSYFCFM